MTYFRYSHDISKMNGNGGGSYQSKVGTWLESVNNSITENPSHADSTLNHQFVKQQNVRLARLTKQLEVKNQEIETLKRQNLPKISENSEINNDSITRVERPRTPSVRSNLSVYNDSVVNPNYVESLNLKLKDYMKIISEQTLTINVLQTENKQIKHENETNTLINQRQGERILRLEKCLEEFALNQKGINSDKISGMLLEIGDIKRRTIQLKNERKAEFEMGESRWFELKEMYLGSQGGTGLREIGASEQQMKKAELSESNRHNGRGNTERRTSKQTAFIRENEIKKNTTETIRIVLENLPREYSVNRPTFVLQIIHNSGRVHEIVYDLHAKTTVLEPKTEKSNVRDTVTRFPPRTPHR